MPTKFIFARRKATTTLVLSQYEKGVVNYYGFALFLPRSSHNDLTNHRYSQGPLLGIKELRDIRPRTTYGSNNLTRLPFAPAKRKNLPINLPNIHTSNH